MIHFLLGSSSGKSSKQIDLLEKILHLYGEGGVTLIKVVLSNKPVYYITLFKMPSKVLTCL